MYQINMILKLGIREETNSYISFYLYLCVYCILYLTCTLYICVNEYMYWYMIHKERHFKYFFNKNVLDVCNYSMDTVFHIRS